jgi:hypothetical protein
MLRVRFCFSKYETYEAETIFQENSKIGRPMNDAVRLEEISLLLPCFMSYCWETLRCFTKPSQVLWLHMVLGAVGLLWLINQKGCGIRQSWYISRHRPLTFNHIFIVIRRDGFMVSCPCVSLSVRPFVFTVIYLEPIDEFLLTLVWTLCN